MQLSNICMMVKISLDRVCMQLVLIDRCHVSIAIVLSEVWPTFPDPLKKVDHFKHNNCNQTRISTM